MYVPPYHARHSTQWEREISVINYFQHRSHLQHGPVQSPSVLQFCGSGPLLHALLGAPMMLQTSKHRDAQTLPQSDWHCPVVVLNGNVAQDVVLNLSMQERSGAPGHVGPGPGAQTPAPFTPVLFFSQTMPSLESTQQSTVLMHILLSGTPAKKMRGQA